MENEITVKINCSILELNEILQSKNFRIIEKFYLDDIYYIPKELQINNMSVRDILSKAIILRKVIESYPDKKRNFKLTVKKKEINEKGDIVKQSKTNCEILDEKSGKAFLEAIGYKELINIKENDIVYEKDDLHIAIKDIENGDKLIEVEENKKYDCVDKLIDELKKLKLPIYSIDYFVKKAEIELRKIL